MINLHNIDCMIALKEMQDNQFDLAIVDPPYGKRPSRDDNGTFGSPNTRKFSSKDDKWDVRPNREYFDELKRVSKHQIIWGFNYFIDYLEPSNAIIVWDKMNGKNMFADCELAWSNYTKTVKKFSLFWLGAHCKDTGGLIHPTQKPVKLYEWILMNYAKEKDKILDTHLGSGSIAIACHNLGFDLEGYELDKDYFNSAKKRLEQHQAQKRLF